LFEAEIDVPGKPRVSITTGPDWRALSSTAWSMAEFQAPDPGASAVSYLRLDATREPEAWRSVRFDDSAWEYATPVESIWGPLAASEIPPRMEAVYPPLERSAITLHSGEPQAVRFDRVLSAYLSFKLRGAAGAVLLIQPDELDRPGFNRMSAVVLRDGVIFYELPFMDSFSTVNLTVTNTATPVEIEDIRASFVSYPVTYRGSFESSDPELNRIWKASRWATQMCMQTRHLDSPDHQEPISDFGDYTSKPLRITTPSVSRG
jgi:alpha-L-rhamnosidase